MFLRFIYRFKELPKTELASIQYSCGIYSNKQGSIKIYFHQQFAQQVDKVDAIRNLLVKAGVTTSRVEAYSLPNSDVSTLDVSTLSVGHYIQLSPQDFRVAIECLFKNNKMWYRDRMRILDSALKFIDDKLRMRSNLATVIVPQQIRLIEEHLSPHIDHIFRIIAYTQSNLDIALTLLNLAFSCIGALPELKRMKFLEICSFTEEVKRSLCESLTPISQAFYGALKLEKLLEENGGGKIPTLALQREVLLNYAKQKLLERFPDLDNPMRLMVVLAFNIWPIPRSLMIEGYHQPVDALKIFDNLKIRCTAGEISGQALIKLISSIMKNIGDERLFISQEMQSWMESEYKPEIKSTLSHKR